MPRNFRHFHPGALDAVDWSSDKVAIIELRYGKPIRYALNVFDKLELLGRRSTLLVAWPGNDRTDIFIIESADTPTRKRIKHDLEELVLQATGYYDRTA